MGDCVEQVCRLCLEKGLASECENIGKITKEMLQVLLININFDTSDYAVACNRCLEKIQDNFDFKSHCITTFVVAANKVDADSVLAREMIRKDETSLANCQVCQFCMSLIVDNYVSYITDLRAGVPLKNIITNCFPEMDLNAVQEASICKQCQGSLAGYYRFRKSCKQAERFWQSASHGTEAIDILREILKSEGCCEPDKPIVKNERSGDENNVIEVTGVKIENNVDIATIKCEELDIKDELDSGGEAGASEHFPEPEDFSGNGSAKKKSQMRKPAPKEEELHFCLKCPFSTKWKKNMKRHMLTHSDRHLDRQSSSDLMEFKCQNCDYRSNRRDNLNIHVSTIHERENATVYSCQLCTFKSVHIRSFHRHLTLHGDKTFSAARLHKCPGCEKIFSEKRALDDHLLKKHDALRHLIASKIFDCQFCAYKSTLAINIKSHVKVKHDRSNAEKFHCHNCNYFTLQKCSLKRHFAVHSNLRPHQCQACKKGFNRKKALDSHVASKHKDSAMLRKTYARKIHECISCNFKTANKPALGRHMKAKHQ